MFYYLESIVFSGSGNDAQTEESRMEVASY
jgi:hypothetical protein